MDIFLDTSDLNQIKRIKETGLIDGVTTNPSLIAQSGQDMLPLIKAICGVVKGPVSAEVTATDAVGMIKEAKILSDLSEHVVIKLPLTKEGLTACSELTHMGIKTNVTLCFSPAQALLAAKAGATYISPFIGRLDDIGASGLSQLEMIIKTIKGAGLSSKILSASIRHVEHAVQSAILGADALTLPPKVLHQMFHHPLTDAGLEAFLKDWKQTGQTIA